MEFVVCVEFEVFINVELFGVDEELMVEELKSYVKCFSFLERMELVVWI